MWMGSFFPNTDTPRTAYLRAYSEGTTTTTMRVPPVESSSKRGNVQVKQETKQETDVGDRG